MFRPRNVRILLVLIALLALPHLVFAVTRTVRKDGTGNYTTVQAAVIASAAGDIIEVGPGTYTEQVDVYVKLTFISTAGAAATIMDGMDNHYPLWFRGGVGSSVDGFTFSNGYNFSGGGAIRCMGGATLTLKNSILANNVSDFDGGALFTRDPGAFIDAYDCVLKNNYAAHNGAAGIAILGSRINYTRCTFFGNSAGEQNGGASCDRSFMDIKQCLFYGNTSPAFSPIYYHLASGTVEQSTIYGNHSGEWASVLIHGSTVTVTRNIIGGDTGGSGLGYLDGGSGPHTCNLFYQNTDSNVLGSSMHATEIVGNPLFCDIASIDYHVGPTSPAAPTNNSCGVLLGALGVSCGTVAVAISSFEALPYDGAVLLRGKFSSNMTVETVNVYRGDGEGLQSMVRIASVSVVDGEKFEYVDKTVTPGKLYRYQISVVDGDGEFVSQLQRVHVAALRTGLEQNRPNPFNPTTTIGFTVAASERVVLVVYDAAGRVVRTLVNETRAPGAYDVTWDGRDNNGGPVASGVYFCQLKAGKVSEAKRMIMLK